MKAPGPLVLGVRPAAGWRAASPTWRVVALSAPVPLAGWCAALSVMTVAPGAFKRAGLVILAVWLTAGLAAAARVVRPHPPGWQVERSARHAAAAFAGATALLWAATTTGAPVLLAGIAARAGAVSATLTVLTLTWGAAALLLRAAGHVAARLHRPTTPTT